MKRTRYKRSLVLPIILGCSALVGVLFLGVREVSSPSAVQYPITPTPAGIGEVITFSGELVCLPHKNTSGPQTMECAYGLKTPEGMYYALRDSDPTYKHISGVAMGKHVAVEGRFVPQTDKIYPTEGVLEIISLTQM